MLSHTDIVVNRFLRTGTQNFPGPLKGTPQSDKFTRQQELADWLDTTLPALDNGDRDYCHASGEIWLKPDASDRIQFGGDSSSGTAVRRAENEYEKVVDAFRYQDGVVEGLSLISYPGDGWKTHIEVTRFSDQGGYQWANPSDVGWLMKE